MTAISIDDPQYVKKDEYSFFDRLILPYINDERDLVFVYLTLKLLLFVVAFAVYFYTAQQINLWIAAAYLVINWSLLLGPFVLMLHCTCHRTLYKSRFSYLNKIIPWLLGPFFGQSPETFYTHHVGMHHPENNLEDDLSSTMHYQRDSFIDFMKYFIRFFFMGLLDIRKYFLRKNRHKLLKKTMVGEFSLIGMIVVLSYLNLPATLILFVLPVIFVRFMMMSGNWAQHAFIDANDPSNCYRNSITCINVRYNKQCFNDGYHIVHHNAPTMHYTEMPGEFLNNIATYANEKAIIFEGLDFFMIWVLLMTKSYKILSRKMVALDEHYPIGKDRIAFLKSRTKKF
jgi:fatty acid desaturase